VKDDSDNKNKGIKYDKIKHLVEVDDDILAVFSINSMNSHDMKELYIAKNAKIDKNYIDSLVHILGLNQVTDVEKSQVSAIGQEKEIEKDDNLLGNIKWIVMEYDKIRILKIFEEDKTIFVLINSNTQLEHTVDNILGYYYDLDETPRSLF
jgi:hypothetical protein